MGPSCHRLVPWALLLPVPLACLAFAACPPSNPVKHPPPVVPDMSLGPGDIIVVDVFNEKELEKKTFQVAQDGSIDYPLIERLVVEGLNPEAVAGLVALKLVDGGFLKNPQVSVLVEEYNSKRIHVLGEVKKPGTFSYEEDMSVVHAITLAGGFTPLAKESRVSITRKVEGKEIVFVVDMQKIVKNKSTNVPLQAGDIVYIPERIF
ncbi:MAG: polysaccharide biosynthesis/export family protein [Deltaproteobacteria bacterium]|nr:polysaccharide biosynthesis/export family protein [Deltaproteobacteria bacterium]